MSTDNLNTTRSIPSGKKASVVSTPTSELYHTPCGTGALYGDAREKLQEETEMLRAQLQEQAEEMSQLVTEKVLGRKA